MFWLWLEPATHWIVPYSSAAKVTKAALSALGELAAHGDPEVHEVLVSRLRDRPMLCMERGNIVSGLGAARLQMELNHLPYLRPICPTSVPPTTLL